MDRDIPIRSYAKKANKKHEPSQKADNVLDFDEKELDTRFVHVVESLKDQFGSMRVGRANPALLDKVRVIIEDTPFSLRDVAQVMIRDPQTLVLTVNAPEYVKEVEKGIREANLNLNPVVENKIIRVPVPKPTKDAKDKLVKLAQQAGEQAKARVRLVRQEGMKHIKQFAKGESADQVKKLEKTVQALTDRYNKMIDEQLKVKVKDIQS